MLSTCVVIPPFIKPYSPSYTAGILADIIRKCSVSTYILDVNLLLLEYLYSNNLKIYFDGNFHTICSNKLEPLLKELKIRTAAVPLFETTYNQIYNEVSLRNILLNKYIENITFGFFDIRMRNQKATIAELLVEDTTSQAMLKMYADFLPDLKAEIIFISIMSKEQLYFSYLLAMHVKDKKINCKVVIGGSYFTNDNSDEYRILLGYFDCICLGDAELVLSDIIYNYSTNGKLFSKFGVVVFDGEKIIQTPRTLCKMKAIEKYNFSINDFSECDYFYPISKYPVLTSRECCYGKCLFCTNKEKPQHICRIEKVSHVMSILKTAAINRYSIVEFIDDNIHPKYLKIIANSIIENKLNIKWISNTRFYKEFLDYNLCKKMYDSGCKKFFMGLETYNQETLDAMNKGIEVDDVISILNNIKSTGICTHISILFGFPSETLEQAQKTQQFLYDNISLLDLIEINRFVNHGIKIDSEPSYDVDSIVKETRIKIRSFQKSPTYYNVYKCLK
jgi:radical SAM superfamily enzyme YgiQ (UPF0313 family)